MKYSPIVFTDGDRITIAVGEHAEPECGDILAAKEGRLVAHRFQNDQDTLLNMGAAAFVAFGVAAPGDTSLMRVGPYEFENAIMILRELPSGMLDGFNDKDSALVAGQWVAECQEDWEELYARAIQ